MAFVIKGQDLTVEDIVKVARNNEKVELQKDSIEKMKICRAMLEKKIVANEIMYGVNTGIGEFSEVVLTGDQIKDFQKYLVFDIRGAYVGATALSMGVTLEAIATKLMCNGVIQRLSDKALDVGKLSYRYIIKFYYPLALTSYLILGIHPLVTFFVSKSRLSVESLAIYPVLNSLVFIFRSFGFSYQEVGIALLDKDFNNYKPLRNFAFKIGLITTSAVALIAFTPLSHLWLKHVSGLSIDLVNLSLIPLSILVLMPGLTTLLAWQRSILVRTERTFPITIATLIEVLIIIIMFCILIYIFNFVGIIAAAISLVLGRLFANIYLFFPYYKLKKEKILSKEGHYFLPKFIRKKFSTSDGFSGPPLKTKGP